MSDQSKLGLGQIITTEQHKDAVHIAVAPVVAAQRFSPGERVGLDEQGRAIKAGYSIGVVDPFLQEFVDVGERFWLYLYPGSITSLRHEWSHPAFEKPTLTQVTAVDASKEESIAWMKAWAAEHMGHDYYGDEDKLDPEVAYTNAIEAGRRTHIGPYESARDHIDDTWWDHWEKITGMRGQRGEYFSCSC